MKPGWEKVTLGDAFKIVTGNTPSKKVKENYGTEISLVKPPELLNNNIGMTKDGLSKLGASLARIAPRGSVLVSCIGNLGKIGLATEEVAFNQQINAIFPDVKKSLPKYVFYLSLTPLFRDQLDSLAKGTTVAIVNKSRFSSIEVPLPPLEEQRRIVALLDQAFEGLDRARAKTEANLQNARELFENTLNTYVDNPAKGNTEYTLGELCDFIGGSQPPKTSFEYVPGPGLIRLLQIRDYKSDKKAVYIPKSLARRFCNEEDVMIGRYGPPLFQILRGKVGAYNVALMKAEPNTNLITKDFLFYLLRNSKLLRYVERQSNRAAGQSGVNKKGLNPYKVFIPKKAKQTEYVELFKKLELKCTGLLSLYELQSLEIDNLRQSLLAKAFAGELT